VIDDGLFAVFQYADAAAVEIEVPLVPVEGEHHVPQLHCLVETELLSQKQRQPPKAIILGKDLLLFEPVPKL
jgi:hypothetical protein